MRSVPAHPHYRRSIDAALGHKSPCACHLSWGISPSGDVFQNERQPAMFGIRARPGCGATGWTAARAASDAERRASVQCTWEADVTGRLRARPRYLWSTIAGNPPGVRVRP